MNTSHINLIYFSPTGTTRQVVKGIADGIETESRKDINLTSPFIRGQGEIPIENGISIIGVPVYSGRVPPLAADAIGRMKVDGSPAVLVVVYGNRKYEDALLELRDLAADAGFIPLAGGAFIGEHSYASHQFPIAKGRPDLPDLQAAAEFGDRVQQKLSDIHSTEAIGPLTVPGNKPYRDPHVLEGVTPQTREAICTLCETCATVCPTQAITVDGTVVTESGDCILCCACVKNCPSEARVLEHPKIEKILGFLQENFSQRQEPEFFL